MQGSLTCLLGWVVCVTVISFGVTLQTGPGMQAYWIRVERQPLPTILNLGAGITADSEEDARSIFAEAFGAVPIVSITAISGMNTLDQGHVVPNMGNWFRKGVWFPQGYEHSN
jgi:hypothetical protein